jgi:hypothetical protein
LYSLRYYFKGQRNYWQLLESWVKWHPHLFESVNFDQYIMSLDDMLSSEWRYSYQRDPSLTTYYILHFLDVAFSTPNGMHFWRTAFRAPAYLMFLFRCAFRSLDRGLWCILASVLSHPLGDKDQIVFQTESVGNILHWMDQNRGSSSDGFRSPYTSFMCGIWSFLDKCNGGPLDSVLLQKLERIVRDFGRGDFKESQLAHL